MNSWGKKRPSQPRFATSQPHSQAAFETQWMLLMEEIRLTTWDVQNPVNNGINYLSTGAGFLPSTVVMECSVVPSSLGLASFCSSRSIIFHLIPSPPPPPPILFTGIVEGFFFAVCSQGLNTLWNESGTMWSHVIKFQPAPWETLGAGWGHWGKLRSTRPCCQHVKNSGKKYFHSTSFGSHLSGRSLKPVAWHRCSCLADVWPRVTLDHAIVGSDSGMVFWMFWTPCAECTSFRTQTQARWMIWDRRWSRWHVWWHYRLIVASYTCTFMIQRNYDVH